jgi:hypothetical protein
MERFPAVVADVLENRPLVRGLTGTLLATLALGALGDGGWPCPVRWALGLPCPGCGLSRGTLELLAGHGSAALAWHPLAPLALAAVLLMTLAALLPPPAARPLVVGLRRIEGRVPLAHLVVAALLVVWALRLWLPSLTFVNASLLLNGG